MATYQRLKSTEEEFEVICEKSSTMSENIEKEFITKPCYRCMNYNSASVYRSIRKKWAMVVLILVAAGCSIGYLTHGCHNRFTEASEKLNYIILEANQCHKDLTNSRITEEATKQDITQLTNELQNLTKTFGNVELEIGNCQSEVDENKKESVEKEMNLKDEIEMEKKASEKWKQLYQDKQNEMIANQEATAERERKLNKEIENERNKGNQWRYSHQYEKDDLKDKIRRLETNSYHHKCETCQKCPKEVTYANGKALWILLVVVVVSIIVGCAIANCCFS